MNNAELTKNESVQLEKGKAYLDLGGLNKVCACERFSDILISSFSVIHMTIPGDVKIGSKYI